MLVHLTGVSDGRMRSADLAGRVEWEKSRMSHQVSRMTKRGLVVREECPQDGRGAFVVITPAGRDAIASAAPRHVESVHRLFVDPLTPEELQAFARIADRVLDQLEDRRLPRGGQAARDRLPDLRQRDRLDRAGRERRRHTGSAALDVLARLGDDAFIEVQFKEPQKTPAVFPVGFLRRYLADGKTDRAFGQAGRVTTLPLVAGTPPPGSGR